MKENLGKPYYGYRINTYITDALIGSGIVGIAPRLCLTCI